MINSTANSLCKLVKKLHYKKGRLEHKLYLAEGTHLLQEAIKSQIPIQQIVWTAKFRDSAVGQSLAAQIPGNVAPVAVSEAVFRKISETQHPQGVLALIASPPLQQPDFAQIKLGLVLDGIQDPGNLGTIMRTAWAVGVDALLFLSNTADPYQGKVVRASMGGIFFQKIYQDLDIHEVCQQARRNQVQIIAGTPLAKTTLFTVDLKPPTLIVVGNEGSGYSSKWDDNLIQKVTIPQPGKAESLNVAVSAGLFLYEAIRQRMFS